MQTNDFVHALDDEAIANAIADAERSTSGEIRVFVTEKVVTDPVAEAEKQFIALGMIKTKMRNGVLLYFSPKSRTFAVIGDQGVHERCGQKFWEHITEDMLPLLRENQFTEAITRAVREIGAVLAREFPRQPDDQDELPNRIERDH